MGSIDKLFGSALKQTLGDGMGKLFGRSSEPLDAKKLKVKARTVLAEPAGTGEQQKQEKQEKEVEEEVEHEVQPEAGEKRALAAEEGRKKVSKRQKRKTREAEEADVEADYYSKLLRDETSEKQDAGAESAEAGEAAAAPSAAPTTTTNAAKKNDLKEAELEKAERTVFVGNVPKDVVTSKAQTKRFKKLFSIAKDASSSDNNDEDNDDNDNDDDTNDNSVAYAIESLRFRSISFEEALPRKVAFVQQKLHKSRESVNAYVVYVDRAAVPAACRLLNGRVFEGHHLRVDSVAHPTQHDNKRSVFVGNLDFEETEENLWKHFLAAGDIEYVRVIRDSKTNVGKGFAYVQFTDFQTVAKALLMDGHKLNGSGRKLRVTRCRNVKKAQSSPHAQGGPRGLTDHQKSKLGRARKILGKADRSSAGKAITIEGLRATKGDTAPQLKKKKERSKTGRVTKRSTAFKKANQSK
ncbi:LADA_0F06942g1_1 [Lachancea dasiensis]|uniref:Nucleolar protein 12 n=1 Tax=Lachancea dasiensis TaxID=1072105 RepID=A0A1G4JK17_9SACH|nr:LADA_0F06942g1_1 [Lachancea dasiensis]